MSEYTIRFRKPKGFPFRIILTDGAETTIAVVGEALDGIASQVLPGKLLTHRTAGPVVIVAVYSVPDGDTGPIVDPAKIYRRLRCWQFTERGERLSVEEFRHRFSRDFVAPTRKLQTTFPNTPPLILFSPMPSDFRRRGPYLGNPPWRFDGSQESWEALDAYLVEQRVDGQE